MREEDFVHFKDPKKKQGLDTQSCNLRHIFYSEALVLDVGENPFYALVAARPKSAISARSARSAVCSKMQNYGTVRHGTY